MNQTQISVYARKVGESLAEIEGKKVLVVGDVGVDEYIWGEVKRISPEAPVPVVDVTKQDSALGLSANVAANINTLGGHAKLLGVVGSDSGAETLTNLLNGYEVSGEFLITDSSRPTTRKVRILGEHQQVVRVDFEQKKFVTEGTEKLIVDKVKQLMSDVDIVILQDYAKGMFTESVCQKVIQTAHENEKKVLVDPHRNTPIHFYKNADLFKPNYDESLMLSGFKYNGLNPPDNLVEQVAKKIQEDIQAQQVVITLGKQGVLIYSDNDFTRLPTVAKEVFDVTGAGDTVIASLSLGLAAGWTIDMACAFANFAAGVVVGKVGCKPCYKDELLQSISRL